MKKTVFILSAILISSASFADTASIKSLGAVWKAQQSIHAKEDKNDITIVYGGADISRRPTIASHITTA